LVLVGISFSEIIGISEISSKINHQSIISIIKQESLTTLSVI